MSPDAANRYCKAAAETFNRAIAQADEPAVVLSLAQCLSEVAGYLGSDEAPACKKAYRTLLQKAKAVEGNADFYALRTLAAGLMTLAPHMERAEFASSCQEAAGLLTPARVSNVPIFALVSTRWGLVLPAHPDHAEAACFRKEAAELLIRALAGSNPAGGKPEDKMLLETLLSTILSGVDPVGLSPSEVTAAFGTPCALRSGGPTWPLMINSEVTAAFGTPCAGPNLACVPLGIMARHFFSPSPLSDQDLVDLLKGPLCTGKGRRLILDKLEDRHGRRFADHWEFVRFADESGLHLDFLGPPKR